MKKIFAFVLALVMVCMFSACNITPTVVYDSHNDNEVTIVFADLAEVPGYKHLYYSVNTHTVYYLYGITSTVGSTFMDSYISNGNSCKYLDGKIVEVVNGEIVAVVEITTWEGKNTN